ncbi:GNAT family N-acetyltransferase [Candidatus Bipolaricaulota bacterium]|nr:GNAT family N-acetyltransferase [Candidatus Bipolaricaulota bacterium]
MRESVSGKLVTVCAYQEKHIDALFEAVSESISDVARYETWCHPGFTRDEAAEYVNWWRTAWAARSAFYFAVEDSETGILVGSCGLSGICSEHRRAELGYWIRSGQTGQGFATDAARAVARLGFEDLGLARIEIEVSVDNAASLRVAEKVGGTREGTLRQRLILPAGPTDTVMFALLRDNTAAAVEGME